MVHAIPTQTGGIVQFDLNAFVSSRGDNRARLFVRDDTAGGVAGAQIDLNGAGGTEIRFNSGTASHPNANADPNWWYQLRMLFDLDADTVTHSYKRDDAGTYTVLAPLGLNPGFTMSELILEVRQRGDLNVTPNGAAGFLDDIVVIDPGPVVAPSTNIVVEDTAGISFNSDTGIVYKLQCTPDLVSSNYGDTGAFVLGDGSGMTLFDPSGTSTTKNYRVTVESP
jgi:hypothetical protein